MSSCKIGKIEYLILRRVSDDSLHVVFVPAGWRPGPAPGYYWAGPFRSCRDAYKAVGCRDAIVAGQLYPEGVPVLGDWSIVPGNEED